MNRSLRTKTRNQRLAFVLAVVAVAVLMQVFSLQPAVSQGPELTAYRVGGDIELDPDAAVWSRAGSVDLPLTAQQAAWPLGGGSVKMLEARAVHSDTMLFLRLSWEDETGDFDATAVDRFVDAAAVEFPIEAKSSVPALCMGQSDSGVNIWHWQAGVAEGRPDDIVDLSIAGYVDRYPSTDDLYFPARAAGNPVAEPRLVNDLVAAGFGTLAPSSDQEVRGQAEWARGHWEVVFARELPVESIERISLDEDATVDVAFAIWDGSNGERNGKKSVSQFVVLRLASGEAPRQATVALAIMLGGLLVVGALLFQVVSERRQLAPDHVRISP